MSKPINEMSFEELSEYAVTLPGWKWTDGMLTTRFGRVDGNGDADGIHTSKRDEWEIQCFPDFHDDATRGCLLGMVQDAYGKTVWAEPDTREGGDMILQWTAVSFDGCYATSELGHGPTPVHALIAALAAAPVKESK